MNIKIKKPIFLIIKHALLSILFLQTFLSFNSTFTFNPEPNYNAQTGQTFEQSSDSYDSGNSSYGSFISSMLYTFGLPVIITLGTCGIKIIKRYFCKSPEQIRIERRRLLGLPENPDTQETYNETKSINKTKSQDKILIPDKPNTPDKQKIYNKPETPHEIKTLTDCEAEENNLTKNENIELNQGKKQSQEKEKSQGEYQSQDKEKSQKENQSQDKEKSNKIEKSQNKEKYQKLEQEFCKPFDFEHAQTFSEWASKCEKLPTPNFDTNSINDPILSKEIYSKTALTRDEFIGAITGLINLLEKSSIGDPENWIKEESEKKDKIKTQENNQDDQFSYSKKDFDVLAFNDKTTYERPKDKFFGQINMIPINSENIAHADIHGEIHPLIKFLQKYFDKGLIDDNFKIKDKNTFFIFLGDFTDKGPYGAEVWYTIARLKAANLEKVILHRGNHDSCIMNIQGGFIKHLVIKKQNIQNQSTGAQKMQIQKIDGELISKFGLTENYSCYLMQKLYNLLPSLSLFKPNYQTELTNHDALSYKNNNPELTNHDALSSQVNNPELTNQDALSSQANNPELTNQDTLSSQNNNPDYVMYKHGGIEPRFNPSLLFKNNKEQKNKPVFYTQINKLSVNWLNQETKNEYPGYNVQNEELYEDEEPINPDIKTPDKIIPLNLGYLWNDYCLDKTDKSSYNPNRGNTLSKNFTDNYFKHLKNKFDINIPLDISGHQHGGETFKKLILCNGIYNICNDDKEQWDGKNKTIKINPDYPVFKMNTSADNMLLYPGSDIRYDYDTHMRIKFNGPKSYKWEIEPCKIQVYNK